MGTITGVARRGGAGIWNPSCSSACFCVQHRPLELLGLRQHPEPIDRLLVRGQDVEVAVAEHPAEHALLEDRVVDLLEGAVRGALLQDALDLHHPAVRDHVILGIPGQVDLDEPREPDQQQDRGPRSRRRHGAGRGESGREHDEDQRGDEDRPGQPALEDRGEEVLPATQPDALTVRQQPVRVPCHRAPP